MFQPTLTPIQSKPFIAPGVAEPPSALGGLLGIASDAYTGYKVAEYEATQEKTMQQYMDTPSEEQIQGLAYKGAEQQHLIDQQWNSGLATWEGVDVAEKNLGDIQQKLINAAQQGIFSADQLNTRMLNNLRQAINNNPGMERELVDQTRKLMEYSGIKSVMSNEEAQQKAAAKAKEQQAQMDKEVMMATGVFFNSGTPELRQQAYGTYSMSKDSERVRNAAATSKAQGDLRKEQVEAFVADPATWSKQARGDIAGLDMIYQSSITADPTSTAAQRMLSLQVKAKELKDFYASMKGNVSSDFHSAIDLHIESIKDREKLYGEIAKGGVEAEFAKNTLEAAKAVAQRPYVAVEQEMSIAKKAAEIMSLTPNAEALALAPVVAKSAENIAVWLQNNNPTLNPLLSSNISKPEGKTGVSFVSTFTNDKNINTKTVNEFLALDAQAAQSGDTGKYSQAVSQVVDNWVKSSEKQGKPLNELVDAPTAAKMLDYTVSKLEGFNGDKFVIDYNEVTKSYELTGKDGKKAIAASSTFNNLIKSAQSLSSGSEDSVVKAITGKEPSATHPLPPGSDERWKQEQLVTPQEQKTRDTTSIQILEEELAKAIASGDEKSVGLLRKSIDRIKNQTLPTVASPPPKTKAQEAFKEKVVPKPLAPKEGASPAQNKFREGVKAPSKPATAPQKASPTPTPTQAPKASQKGSTAPVKVPQERPQAKALREALGVPLKGERTVPQSPKTPPVKSTPMSEYPRTEKYWLKDFKKTTDKGGIYTLIDSKGKEYIISNKSTYDAFLLKFKKHPSVLPKWTGK